MASGIYEKSEGDRRSRVPHVNIKSQTENKYLFIFFGIERERRNTFLIRNIFAVIKVSKNHVNKVFIVQALIRDLFYNDIVYNDIDARRCYTEIVQPL